MEQSLQELTNLLTVLQYENGVLHTGNQTLRERIEWLEGTIREHENTIAYLRSKKKKKKNKKNIGFQQGGKNED